jgi:hypothetical protein
VRSGEERERKREDAREEINRVEKENERHHHIGR